MYDDRSASKNVVKMHASPPSDIVRLHRGAGTGSSGSAPSSPSSVPSLAASGSSRGSGSAPGSEVKTDDSNIVRIYKADPEAARGNVSYFPTRKWLAVLKVRYDG